MRLVFDSLIFPFQRGGRRLFIGLAVLQLLVILLAVVPVLGWALSLLVLGYVYATYFHIIYRRGVGDSEAPDFPDLDDPFENLIAPLFKVLLIHLLSFGPLLVYLWQSGRAEPLPVLALTLFAHLYRPVGMMIAAMDESLRAMNPAVVFSTLRALGPGYLLAVAAIALVDLFQDSVSALGFLDWALASLAAAYALCFEARLIGGLYEANSGWDDAVAQEAAAPEVEVPPKDA